MLLFRSLLLFLLFSCYANAVPAQRSVCISGFSDPYTLQYPEGAVDSLLHFRKYKAVLFGEQHNERIDPELKYHLITYLNKAYGYRHVFAEVGVSTAGRYNQFLKTGDTTQFHTYPGYARFWQRMYEYNKALPGDKKIIFHGLDFERKAVFRVIHELSPAGKPVPLSLQPAMDTAAFYSNDEFLVMYKLNNGVMTLFDNTPFERRLRWLQEQFKKYPDDAKAFFGDNYAVLNDIIRNESPVEVRPKRRNKTMYRNMKRMVTDHKIDKFIGFFGSYHLDYTIPSALSNAVRGLPGISGKDVLNIKEVFYRENTDSSSPIKIANLDAIKALNKGCKASIYPVKEVRQYKRKTDFVLIADYD